MLEQDSDLGPCIRSSSPACAFQRLPKKCKYLVTLSLVISNTTELGPTLSNMPQRKQLPSGKERPSRRGSGLCAQATTPINFRQLRSSLTLAVGKAPQKFSYEKERAKPRPRLKYNSMTTMTPGHLPIFKRSRVLTRTIGTLLSQEESPPWVAAVLYHHGDQV